MDIEYRKIEDTYVNMCIIFLDITKVILYSCLPVDSYIMDTLLLLLIYNIRVLNFFKKIFPRGKKINLVTIC